VTPAGETDRPVIEVFDNLMPAEVFSAACDTCKTPRWEFGHESHHDDPLPFWALDLNGDAVFDAVWEKARPACEALAGRALRVIRQYATGHTYGLGGKPHNDDRRAGCFTLLYYSMPEWKQEWDGETVFYDAEGEILQAVSPRPNRAVFFDSRVIHAGRAPGRSCPALRIAVAFKLEPVALAEMPPADGSLKTASGALQAEEISRAGAERIYAVRVPGAEIAAKVRDRLLETGKALRLPGFRPGKVPAEVLAQRYGARARESVRAGFAVEAAHQLLAEGNLTASTQPVDEPESGDLLLRLTVTHLPDLPDPNLENITFTRLTGGGEAASAYFEGAFRQQVMDRLDADYRFPVAPVLIRKELAALRAVAEGELNLLGAEDRAAAEAELSAIAERRVRLGAVMVELARRFGIVASDVPAEARGRIVEDRVVGRLTDLATVNERAATAEELQRPTGGDE
jgi:hypothetical protein